MKFAQLKCICERNWRNFKYVKVYICDDFFPRVIIFMAYPIMPGKIALSWTRENSRRKGASRPW